MTDHELQKLVEQVSIQDFGKPFKHRAIFNRRLRTTGGRYLLHTHHLEFNPEQLSVHGLDEFIKIIKHELCHYHLHLEGRGYKHRDADFKACLLQVGGSRYCKPIKGKEESRYAYALICRDCGMRYLRKKRMDPKRYRCGRCHGLLSLLSIDPQKGV